MLGETAVAGLILNSVECFSPLSQHVSLKLFDVLT